MMLNIKLGALALLFFGASSGTRASPVERNRSSNIGPSILKRNPEPVFFICDDGQIATIKTALNDVTILGKHAADAVGRSDWKTNKGYTHYFKEEDRPTVEEAYTGIWQAELLISARYNIQCAEDDDSRCKHEDGSKSYAYADPTPEDFEGGDYKKGVRIITVCPLFFNSDEGKRRLPGDDKEKQQEFCKFKESKKLGDFITGGHTLTHEITHLDTFGSYVGLPEETQPKEGKTPEYKFHGTIDWNGKSTPGNARILKTSTAKNLPKRYQNAESLTAGATEMYVMEICGMTDIPL